MIVTKVILQDYGVYRGKNEFDLACTQTKPIVLVGGTNGAGKTTLFESIALCLYGISAMGKRGTKKTYNKFLARKIHRYLKSATPADHASVVVQFKFFHNGQEMEYRVERSWRNEGGMVEEQLDIKKRSLAQKEFGPLETMEKSYWQSFIEDLIPRGIIRLFFFDGEKIVGIAKEGTEDATIRESFNSLLGIEIVEQLRTDLQVNLMRNLAKESGQLQQDFEKHKAEKDECVNSIERLQEKIAQKQTEMDAVRMEIDNLESKVSKIGGKFASSRNDAKAKLAAKRLVYENILQRIRDLCSGVLPFSLIPAELEKLSEQIRIDESIQQQAAGQKLLDSKLKGITSQLKMRKFWNGAGLDANDMGAAVYRVSELLKKEMKMSAPIAKPAFGFSTEQTSRIAGITQQANSTALQNLGKDAAKIVEVGEAITKLEASIANAPSDDEIGPLISKVGEMHSQAGALQAEMDHIEEKISSNTALKRHLDVKLRDVVSLIYKSEKSRQHVDLTQNVQKVLEEFIERLKDKKIHLLEQYLLDAVKTLMHKKNFIKKVSVDPETFEVALFRKNDDPLPKDMLSEGEKQMFAIGVLWALAKTSGRPLPFMIDTPLARLDESHRTNIVEKFFPIASHQIMIFSTDKEIENNDYRKLKPYMARSYAMEYLEDEGTTKKHDGYFWNREGKRVVAVP